MGPLLTLSKQLGHHVLTAGLGLLRLARQAAVCRFQSLCLKLKKDVLRKDIGVANEAACPGVPWGPIYGAAFFKQGMGSEGSL